MNGEMAMWEQGFPSVILLSITSDGAKRVEMVLVLVRVMVVMARGYVQSAEGDVFEYKSEVEVDAGEESKR